MKRPSKRVIFAIVSIVLTVVIVSYVLLIPAGSPIGSLKVTPPSSISVRQAEYDKDGLKIASVLLPADKRLENTSFHVMEAETNETMFTGDLAYLGIYWNQSGWRSDAIYLANFTDLIYAMVFFYYSTEHFGSSQNQNVYWRG
jgi:hypothetical protein